MINNKFQPSPYSDSNSHTFLAVDTDTDKFQLPCADHKSDSRNVSDCIILMGGNLYVCGMTGHYIETYYQFNHLRVVINEVTFV